MTVPTAPRVALHLHPDRPVDGGAWLLEAVARDGRYRSQFETGTSNGGLTAHPGGDRWRWESRLFGGRYDDGPDARRPVYGAVVATTGSPYGPAPRFGSAHLRLRPELVARSTFCFPDSVFEPDAAHGPDGLDALLDRCAGEATAMDPLDGYVEAQVHGGVRVPADVEAVVLDPSHRGGPVEDAARRLGCAVEWHPGFVVADPAGLDRGYRTGAAVDLAIALAAGGPLTPAALGGASRTGDHDPQVLKHAWHLLARFGRADAR